MQRSRQRSILIVFSFVILIFCICAGQKATGDPAAFTSADLTMEDPWSEEVFKSRKFHNLVVSLCVSEEDLYAEGSGLLTDGCMLRGRDGEHPVRIFVYEPDGTPLIAQDAGIRLNGASSRTAIRKSFRIIARKEYDRSHPVFTCDLWGGRKVLDGSGADIREYSSFILQLCTSFHGRHRDPQQRRLFSGPQRRDRGRGSHNTRCRLSERRVSGRLFSHARQK